MASPLDWIGSAADFAKGVLDRVLPEKMTEEERSAAELAMTELIAKRDDAMVTAKRDIMVAELAQGDTFTKRARPMIVYFGLAAVGFNHVLVPFINRVMEWIVVFRHMDMAAMNQLAPMSLPTEFWWAWTGVVGVYAVGRSMEKRGTNSTVVGAITGNRALHK